MQELFTEARVDASENYQSSLTPGEEGVVVNENGDPVAYSTEDGSVLLSLRTYDEEGRQTSELMTTHYRSGPRIDYQKSIWEYHENGKYKTVSIQKWTSYDEAKYPNADPAAWGKTTVTHYDENGNKIKK